MKVSASKTATSPSCKTLADILNHRDELNKQIYIYEKNSFNYFILFLFKLCF